MSIKPGALPLDRSNLKDANLTDANLTDHDHCHADSATKGGPAAAFKVTNALLQRAHARRRFGVAHDFSALLTRRHSIVVSRPSFRACRAASSRRSASIRPRHSRMASATGCAFSPS